MGKFQCDSRLGPGNFFLIEGMNAPDRSGRVLLGLARLLSYMLRWGGAGLVLNERTRNRI
jgi:hypothetical protein